MCVEGATDLFRAADVEIVATDHHVREAADIAFLREHAPMCVAILHDENGWRRTRSTRIHRRRSASLPPARHREHWMIEASFGGQRPHHRCERRWPRHWSARIENA